MERRIFTGGGLIIIAALLIFLLNFEKPQKGLDPEPHSPLPATLVDTTPFGLTILAFDDFLEQNLDSSHTVGAAAIIVRGDSTAYLQTFGVRRAGTSDPVTPHTVFRLASVSKGFTGVLALLLEEEGVLSMQDPVLKYLPDLLLKDSASTADLKIYHLLNHTSGLVPHAYDNLAEAGQEIREILPQLSTVDISAPPGELYGYQNVLFSLFDTISSTLTGKNFNLLLDERIFHPLGMKNASAGFYSLVWNPDVAFPHISRSGRYTALPMHTGYYNLMPAAGINASISDMGLWLRALLGNEPDIFDGALLEQIATPQIYTPLKRQYTRNWDSFKERYYSYGWRIYDYKGRRIMYHGGYVRGYRAEIAFCPSENVGMAFLQNSPNGLAGQCVPTFFNMLFAGLDGTKVP